MAHNGKPSTPVFERYREYLHLLARLRLPPQFRGKISASDLVQETLLKAHQHQDQIRGQTEEERAGYLRRILANTLVDAIRRHKRNKRDPALEQSLEGALDQSSVRIESWLAASQSSPSSQAAKHEQLLRMAEALATLPEAQRAALELRYLQEPPYSLAEIAQHLSRTEKAAASLLYHGLQKLRKRLGDDSKESSR